MDFANIKEKALKKLKGKYGVLIGALLIYNLINALLYGTSKLIYNEYLNVAFIIITTGLFCEGIIEIISKISKGRKVKISDMFKKMELFWKSAAVTIILLAVSALCFILGSIAFNSLTVFTLYQSEMPLIMASSMILLGTVLCGAIAVFYTYLMVSFSQVYYILHENEKMSVIDIFSKSMDLTNGHVIDYIIFNLTFIGWIVLGIFTFGLLYIWLDCYMIEANYLFYNELKKNQKTQKVRVRKKKWYIIK